MHTRLSYSTFTSIIKTNSILLFQHNSIGLISSNPWICGYKRAFHKITSKFKIRAIFVWKRVPSKIKHSSRFNIGSTMSKWLKYVGSLESNKIGKVGFKPSTWQNMIVVISRCENHDEINCNRLKWPNWKLQKHFVFIYFTFFVSYLQNCWHKPKWNKKEVWSVLSVIAMVNLANFISPSL